MITLESVSAELLEGVRAALPRWVERHVRRLAAAAAVPYDGETQRLVDDASQRCVADVVARLDDLLATDIDAQRTNPLQIVRDGISYPTGVLTALGVPHVVRDEFAEANFPLDVYDLSPASFGDVSPELQELGIAWGAAKAHTHLQRRRDEGMR